VQKQQDAKCLGSSQWALLTQRRQLNILDETTLSSILEWWNNEMKVSPNKLNVTRKCIALKAYEEHVMHLLFKTLVKTSFPPITIVH
jgi:hypothetical protein